ncbi:hypothetical protein Golax_020376 [Gossypium laxum]|uniref:Uncharacterized protein n=1 Tax=Gossypium laxum TaxID=34288 RepID=A0A7J9B076_9ROSI|nr:hypothetical protein [Gossypium laxum]
MHPDVRKRVDVFALSIYGLVVFPKALGHVDEAVTDLFDRLDKGVIPISIILAETFRVSYRVFSENYSPLKEIVATRRRDDISEEKWMAILQNIQEEDIEWRAHWLLSDKILYRDDGYRKKIQEISSAWKQTRQIKRLAVGLMKTPEYNEW